MKKNVFFRALPESPKPLPPWPQLGQLGPKFSDIKIKDLKVTWGQCGEGRELYQQPKKQFKFSSVQYIGIIEEIDSF